MFSSYSLSVPTGASSSSGFISSANKESTLHDSTVYLDNESATTKPLLDNNKPRSTAKIVAKLFFSAVSHNASSKIPQRIPTYVIFKNGHENEQFRIGSEMNSKKGPINEVDVDEIDANEVDVNEVDVDEVDVNEVDVDEVDVNEVGVNEVDVNVNVDEVGFETVKVESVGKKVLACVKNLVLSLFASIKSVLARVKTSEKMATKNKHSLISHQANKVNSTEGSRLIGLADQALKILNQEVKKHNITYELEPKQKIEMLVNSQEWLSFLFPSDFLPKSDGESSVDWKGIGAAGQTSLTEKEELLLKVHTQRAVEIISKKTCEF